MRCDWRLVISLTSVAKLKKEISPVSLLLQMETAANEILTDKTINPLFQRAYNVRGWINARAYEIKHEMALVSAGAFLQVLYVFKPTKQFWSPFALFSKFRHDKKQHLSHHCGRSITLGLTNTLFWKVVICMIHSYVKVTSHLQRPKKSILSSIWVNWIQTLDFHVIFIVCPHRALYKIHSWNLFDWGKIVAKKKIKSGRKPLVKKKKKKQAQRRTKVLSR